MPPIMFFSNFPMSYARWTSTPMFYSQCNCGNSGNNKWLNWWMMSEMVKNIGQMFRKQEQPPVPYAYPYGPDSLYSNYPYVNFNNQQQAQYPGQEEPDKYLTRLQQIYNGKFQISKFSNKDGEEIYVAIDKKGKHIKGTDPESLMDAIDAYIEGKGGTRVNNTGDSDSDSDIDIDSDSDIDVDTDTDINTDTDSDSDNDTAARAVVPQGWNRESTTDFLNLTVETGGASFSVSEFITGHSGDNHDYSYQLADLLTSFYGFENLTNENKNKLAAAIKQANPSVFDQSNGNFKENLTEDVLKRKLDLPTKDILKETYGATEPST